VKLNTLAGFNSILSVAPKTGKHWSIYTVPNSGMVSVFMPSIGDFQSSTPLQAGQWHYLAFRLERKSFELYVDGQKALAQTSPIDAVAQTRSHVSSSHIHIGSQTNCEVGGLTRGRGSGSSNLRRASSTARAVAPAPPNGSRGSNAT
jgi:hypothetical protein